MSFALRSQVLRSTQLVRHGFCTRTQQWRVGSAMIGSLRTVMSDREQVLRSWAHSLQLSEQLQDGARFGQKAGYLMKPPVEHVQGDPEQEHRMMSLVSHSEEVCKSWAHVEQLSELHRDLMVHEEAMISMDLSEKVADLEDNLKTLEAEAAPRNAKVAALESVLEDLMDWEASPKSAAQGDRFQPTRDWQPIPENTICSAGLHFQIDVTTGQMLVKLPEESKKQM